MDSILAVFSAPVLMNYGMVLIKILLAALLGCVIGFERELKKKPVGVKTCMIIATTTCILTIVSVQSAQYYAEFSVNIRTDPMRLAAQVISGIGFLGAGVILRKSDDAISGLTTAAIVWAAAGVGIAAGAGFYFDAIIAALAIICAVKISPILVSLLQPKKAYIDRAKLTMELANAGAIERITQRLTDRHHRIDAIAIRDVSHGVIELELTVSLKQKETAPELYMALKQFNDIIGIKLTS
jgi:putative Mg2+ transporter-C (MgtC) family protein